MKKTILLLAASPTDMGRLRLDQEIREIEEGLKLSKKRHEFILEKRLAVRDIDLRRALLDLEPEYVHFCGHGGGSKGIMLENVTGESHLVSAEALAGLFELFADKIQCVVLNACYSKIQAKAIAQHVKYVVGMSQEIGDELAIKFAVGFYDALGAGKDVNFAYKLGCSAIQLGSVSGQHLIPKLIDRETSLEEEEEKEVKDSLVYQHAIYISYAEANEDWVIKFNNDLKGRLEEQLGKLDENFIWAKYLLRGGDDKIEEPKRRLEKSVCLLVILSPAYLHSNSYYEIEKFLEKTNRDQGRIFVVEYDRVERPTKIKELAGYKFWYLNEVNRERHVSDSDYSDILFDIASDLADKLSNKIKELSASLKPYKNSLPPEIIEKGFDSAKSYWESSKKEKQPLHEAKILIVGQGGVGKTSLVNRLIRNIFNDDENKTEGINIETWKVEIKRKTIRLNVWDFGGQEIMHATHQFFLTKRSLYVLVLDARQEEKYSHIEYWLKLIQSFSGDSPIFVVINKIDQQFLEINQKGLRAKYPTIKGFFDISCKKGKYIKRFAQNIKSQINQLTHIHDLFPIKWFAIKNKLENMSQDFIEYSEYEKMCENVGIDENSQSTLIGLLHDLGVILSFRDDELRPQLKSVGILNPRWVTEGIYKLLNSFELFQSKGVLKLSQLSILLDQERYPQKNHRIIMDLMEKFELCFEFPDYKNHFLIPELLSKEEPDINWSFKNNLAFEFHYDVLPDSIISRFIVRTNNLISKKTYWRTGVVLVNSDENNKALIKADIEDKKIFIWVSGNPKTQREFLAIIRHNLKIIHKTITKIQAVEKVPYKNVVIDYNHLLTLEKLKKETFVPEGLAEEINVAELLDGVENRTINTPSIQITIQNTVNDNSRKFENTGTTENSNFNLGNDSEQNTQIKKA